MSGDLIRIYVKVKTFGPQMSELLKMSGQEKKSLLFIISSAFALPSLQSDTLHHNASLLDAGHVQQTAAMLANATLHTEKYYGSDVKVAYRLLQSLLQHESHQQGFNLTATQDVHFTEVNQSHLLVVSLSCLYTPPQPLPFCPTDLSLSPDRIWSA